MQRLLLACVACLLFACNGGETTEATTETAPTTETTAADEWQILFDGSSTDGWRGYNGKTMPPGWRIEGDVLTFDDGDEATELEYEGGKDLIYAAEEFDNFELYLEWKIPPGGNSGIFYHVKEGYGGPPEVAP